MLGDEAFETGSRIATEKKKYHRVEGEGKMQQFQEKQTPTGCATRYPCYSSLFAGSFSVLTWCEQRLTYLNLMEAGKGLLKLTCC
jgi:hypothetical protein